MGEEGGGREGYKGEDDRGPQRRRHAASACSLFARAATANRETHAPLAPLRGDERSLGEPLIDIPIMGNT